MNSNSVFLRFLPVQILHMLHKEYILLVVVFVGILSCTGSPYYGEQLRYPVGCTTERISCTADTFFADAVLEAQMGARLQTLHCYGNHIQPIMGRITTGLMGNQFNTIYTKNLAVYEYNGYSHKKYQGINSAVAESDYQIRFHTALIPYYDKLKLTIDAAESDRDSVWLDLDNNGRCDKGEQITVFGIEQTYTVDSRTPTLYGKVHTLICSFNELKALDIHRNPVLTELDCAANLLQDLDTGTNTNLIKLWCAYCDLKSLTLSSNAKLTDLYCAGNTLTSLDVSNNSLLEKLDCSNNEIEVLDVRNNTKLITVICDNNRLTNLDIRTNTGIERLFCGNNPLGHLDTGSLTKLGVLSCAQNQLNALDVSKNIALEELYYPNNHLTVLDLTANSSLTTVSCAGNELRSKEMDTLVQSLRVCPADNRGMLIMIDSMDGLPEGNICTQTQADIARAKNWRVVDWNDGQTTDYAGVPSQIKLK